MKDWDVYILFLVGSIFVFAFFIGVRKGVAKLFHSKTNIESSVDSRQELNDQQRRAKEIRDRQRELIKANEQKLRDSNRMRGN